MLFPDNCWSELKLVPLSVCRWQWPFREYFSHTATYFVDVFLRDYRWWCLVDADLEKAARGTCGHFVKNTLFWGHFESNILYCWVWREENIYQWRNEVWWRRFEVEGWRIEDLGYKIEVERLWIEDRRSRFEDSIMSHQHSIHMFLFVLCRESRYFEDIVKFLIFRLRTRGGW